MDELFKILARSEMPNFLQVLAALNDISDIDWNRLESQLLSDRAAFEARRVPKYPLFDCSEFCESCG